MNTLTAEGFGDISQEIHIDWPCKEWIATLWMGHSTAGKFVFVKDATGKEAYPLVSSSYRQLTANQQALLTEMSLRQDFDGLAWCHFIFHCN